MNETNENFVLQAVVENPRISLREIANNAGVARSSTGAVLKRFKYHPYREQSCARRMEFCEGFIG